MQAGPQPLYYEMQPLHRVLSTKSPMPPEGQCHAMRSGVAQWALKNNHDDLEKSCLARRPCVAQRPSCVL